MALNDIRSLHSLNGNEPTPNREQRVLAHFAEVRRRKTVGQWQMLDSLAKWQMRLSLSSPKDCAAIKCHSGLKARMPFNAIKNGAKSGKRKTFPTTPLLTAAEAER